VPTSPSTSSHRSEKPKTSKEGSDLSQGGKEEGGAAQQSNKGKGTPLKSGADLGLLYSHRLSHVAETGQLIPRTKRSPVPSGEWLRTAPAREPRPRHPPISMKNRRISRSLPTTPTGETHDPFNFTPSNHPISTISTTATTDRLEHLSIPDVVQPRPPPEIKDTVTISPQQDRFYSKQTGTISAIAALSKPEAAYAPSTFEHGRGSEVLRRVNDGFEILQPGTIPAAQANEPPKDPVPKDKTKRHSRRLSKERPSTSRDRNSFIEVLYGNERWPKH
jgi:hypothetical protein